MCILCIDLPILTHVYPCYTFLPFFIPIFAHFYQITKSTQPGSSFATSPTNSCQLSTSPRGKPTSDSRLTPSSSHQGLDFKDPPATDSSTAHLAGDSNLPPRLLLPRADFKAPPAVEPTPHSPHNQMYWPAGPPP